MLTRQATSYWDYENVISSRHLWESLGIELAFAGTSQNKESKEGLAARLVESCVLDSYGVSFGEFPSLNDR